MTRRVTLDPVTRVEGRARVQVEVGADGTVARAWLQIPEFRGFERFCEGRPAEEMPTLTAKVCGICPVAHHLAASEALDAVYGVEPPPAARAIRELALAASIFEDHVLHFFVLGGPDVLARGGPGGVLSALRALGPEVTRRVLGVRHRVRGLVGTLLGCAAAPVGGLPGGMAKPLAEADRQALGPVAAEALELAHLARELFEERALGHGYRERLRDPTLAHPLYSLGSVDGANRFCPYGGELRAVDPAGREAARFRPADFGAHLAERVDPESYGKLLYLKAPGWHGLRPGADSGVYRVGPLGRLNAAEAMPTKRAQAEYERFFAALGGRPVHHVLAYPWARLVELVWAAERMGELLADPGLADPEVRRLPTSAPREGVGHCEAPRGTLLHHYRSGPDGLLTGVNLLVGTQHQLAAIAVALDSVARGRPLTAGTGPEVEEVLRAFDPCFSCTTHAVRAPPRPPLEG